MTIIDDRNAPAASEEGRFSATIVYILYLLSIPSVFTFLVLGLVIAYVTRAGATGWIRGHLDRQVRIGWTWIWWTLGLTVITFVGFVLSFVLIGLPIWAVGMAGVLVLTLWLMVVSLVGLSRLAGGRPA